MQSPKVWDCRPDRKEDPINWVELKTTAELISDKEKLKYERKLLKFWAQSFLLGVPKIVVGFRDRSGMLLRLEELETHVLPGKVKREGRGSWDGNTCINFTAAFLECKPVVVVCAKSQTNLRRAPRYYQLRRHMAHSEKGRVIVYRGLQN